MKLRHVTYALLSPLQWGSAFKIHTPHTKKEINQVMQLKTILHGAFHNNIQKSTQAGMARRAYPRLYWLQTCKKMQRFDIPACSLTLHRQDILGTKEGLVSTLLCQSAGKSTAGV